MRPLLPLLALALLAGCVATQRDVLELSDQTEELRRRVADLKETVTVMQANQADLLVQFKQVHEDLSSFTETTRQSQDQMSRLASKLDDMDAAVADRVAAIGSSLTSAQAKGIEEQKAALANQLQTGSPSELFQAAEVRLAKKSYDLAAKGFEDYLARYPKGALADVAVYNLGEAYYGLKRWEPAGRQFGTYLEKYPKGAMTPSARLMYALCLVNLRRNPAEARQYLESIEADFPRSPEAKAAARHLKTLPAKS